MSPYLLTLPTGGQRSVPRVTEIIRAGMPRPALQEWELREVVKWAGNACVPSDLNDEGANTVVAAWRREHRQHADRGTAVHRWIAAVLSGAPPPALLASLRGYKIAFTDWMVEHTVGGDGLAEQTMTDSSVSVAGTCDFLSNDGHLFDWKTVESMNGYGIWPDQRAQLGAYASMTRLVSDGRVTDGMPVVRSASIVRLSSDGKHRTFTLAGDDLCEAMSLWRAVLRVARDTMPKTAT